MENSTIEHITWREGRMAGDFTDIQVKREHSDKFENLMNAHAISFTTWIEDVQPLVDASYEDIASSYGYKLMKKIDSKFP
jgi:hypothetical protein